VSWCESEHGSLPAPHKQLVVRTATATAAAAAAALPLMEPGDVLTPVASNQCGIAAWGEDVAPRGRRSGPDPGAGVPFSAMGVLQMAIGHAFQCTEAGAGASAGLGPGVGPGPGAGPAGASYVEGDSQADEEESDAADDDDEEEELASFEEDSTIAIPDEIELAEVGSMEKTLSTIFNLSDAEEEDGDGDELDGCFGGIEIGLSEFEQRDDGDAAVGAEGENDENRLLDEGEARTTDGDGGEGPEKGARGGGPSPLSLSGACTPREALAQQGDDANRPNEAGEAAGGAAPSTGGGRAPPPPPIRVSFAVAVAPDAAREPEPEPKPQSRQEDGGPAQAPGARKSAIVEGLRRISPRSLKERKAAARKNFSSSASTRAVRGKGRRWRANTGGGVPSFMSPTRAFMGKVHKKGIPKEERAERASPTVTTPTSSADSSWGGDDEGNTKVNEAVARAKQRIKERRSRGSGRLE